MNIKLHPNQNKQVDMMFDTIMRTKRADSAVRNGRVPSVAREKIERQIEKLFEKSYETVSTLSCVAYCTKEPIPFEKRITGEKKSLSVGSKWATEIFDCAWMNITGILPNSERPHVFLINTGGEGLVFDKEGNPKQGITCYASEYAYDLGKPVKKVVLDRGLSKDGIVDFWVDCGANDLFGNSRNYSKIEELSIAFVNENIRALAYDLQVLISVWDENKKDAFTQEIYNSVQNALKDLNTINEDAAAQHRQEIKHLLESKNVCEAFQYWAVGHAHLDLAWKWPIRETKRKAIRTFTNQFMNIDLYPEYVFGASQAQLYQWVKEENPDVYKKVLQLAKTPNWDVQGATWVEMDSNLIGGESMVRQFFYGKQFFQREFNQEMKIFWVPDSFGYSACIPQVMKLANVPYFLTQKMSWNTVNKFPYHSFYWEGLDGSKVLAHMLPDNTYNAPVRGDYLTAGERNYQERSISSDAMMLHGIGDGGGGPGFEHIERAMRFKDLKNMPKVKMRKSMDFFNHFDNESIPYPTHSGELYLERHQGTYTTQVQNKWYNRKCEFLLRNYEILMIKALESGAKLPITKEDLDELWKEVLLYQFHDILPGSSINRVYEESVARYKIIFNQLKDGITVLLGKLVGGSAIVNFNSYNYNRNIQVDGNWYNVNVPALSAVSLADAEKKESFAVRSYGNTIENELVRIRFTDGFITSFYDKKADKELADPKKPMGVYCKYKDVGDCWDIRPPQGYTRTRKAAVCTQFKTGQDGAKVFANIKYEVDSSTITQQISLTEGSALVTFDAHVNWNQKCSMLRVEFPTNISTNECNFNIQFGHLARKTTNNNSVEKAQCEVSGQKFVDMSETDNGLSLINEGKYGFKCKNGIMDMDLIRSPLGGPGSNVDQGEHNIRFALYPHEGELSSETYKEAYLFNNPFIIIENGDWIKNTVSLYNSDNENFVLEAVKAAEDKNGFIARFYNASSKEMQGRVGFKGYVSKEIVDIMENNLQDKADDTLTLRGFELINIRFVKEK